MEKRVSENLKDARELVARPNGWTKHSAARTKTGQEVSCWNKKATCFCAIGALWAQLPSSYPAEKEISFLTTAMGDWPLYFNDDPDRTQAEVVAAFDRAIALAEAEGA